MIRLGSWVSSEKNGANEEQLVIPGILSEKSSAKSGIAVAFCFPKNVHLKPILKPKTFNQFSTSNFTIRGWSPKFETGINIIIKSALYSIF